MALLVAASWPPLTAFQAARGDRTGGEVADGGGAGACAERDPAIVRIAAGVQIVGHCGIRHAIDQADRPFNCATLTASVLTRCPQPHW
jgi:hypothetical protein